MKYSQVAQKLTAAFPELVNNAEYRNAPVLGLNYTMSGTYSGSLAYAANTLVIQAALEDLGSNSGGIERITYSFGTKLLAITGDITIAEYRLIYKCLKSLKSYLCLDDGTWSSLVYTEALASFKSWQQSDIISEIKESLAGRGILEDPRELAGDEGLSKLILDYLIDNCKVVNEYDTAYYLYDSCDIEAICDFL